MNPKSRVRVFHESREIEMNKVFAKMVQNPFSEEYAFLQKIRGDWDQRSAEGWGCSLQWNEP